MIPDAAANVSEHACVLDLLGPSGNRFMRFPGHCFRSADSTGRMGLDSNDL
jgi:hypothetical protein